MLQGKRLLALDVGSKRIGVAVSDHAGMLAHPLITLDAQGPFKDAQAIKALLAQVEAHGVVLGLPAHANGTESTSAARVRRLADQLTAAGVTLDFQDEWGTSLDARDALSHTGRKGRTDKGRVDQAAAVAILTAYLDARARAGAGGM